jgi:hypothetical protein
MPKLSEPVHPILEDFEPFERRQAQGPPDQGEIDSVRGFLGVERIRRRLGHSRRPGHEGHYSKALYRPAKIL